MGDLGTLAERATSRHPTPWRYDDGRILDANGYVMFLKINADAQPTAAYIVALVNEAAGETCMKYGPETCPKCHKYTIPPRVWHGIYPPPICDCPVRVVLRPFPPCPLCGSTAAHYCPGPRRTYRQPGAYVGVGSTAFEDGGVARYASR